jgi:hypothetical protein
MASLRERVASVKRPLSFSANGAADRWRLWEIGCRALAWRMQGRRPAASLGAPVETAGDKALCLCRAIAGHMPYTTTELCGSSLSHPSEPICLS